MKLTLNDLVLAQPSLKSVVEGNERMSGGIAYHIARVIRLVDTELRDYHTARQALLKQFGTLSDDKRQWLISPGNHTGFAEEMDRLHSTEIELDVKQISKDKLPNLTVAEALALWWLIDDERGNDNNEHSE